MSTEKQQFVREDQKERWMKYGANVALATLIVLFLAGMVIYLGQRFDHRIDTTKAGLYSLKEQTVNIIKDNNQKVKLVSLYSGKVYSTKLQRQIDSPYAPVVRDLLEEYSRKGKNIEYQAIDPITQPTESLIEEAVNKYGGQMSQYKTFIDEYLKTHEDLSKMVGDEAGALANVQTDSFGNDERGQTMASLVTTIRESIPNDLARLKERIARGMKDKIPPYQDLVDHIKESLESLQQRGVALSRFAAQSKDDPQVPAVLREYLATASPKFEMIAKAAEATAAKTTSLGELKLSTLQQDIKGQDIILVMGENDWKVINFDQVFVSDTRDVQAFLDNGELKERFAGEQAVTTAIMGVSSANKQKVVFVRPGGRPLTTPGFLPFQQGGPLSGLAQRLRNYNYEVLEKDISGMWEMQQRMQQQQMPSAPEPSEEEIKDATWIVLDMPGDGGPAPAMNSKLAEHLKRGGSAMVLAMPGADPLIEALKDYGVSLELDYTIVHEMPQGERPKSADWSEEVQSSPIVFVLKEYGDHMLTKPLQALDSMMFWASPIKTTKVEGATQTNLLPIPQYLKVWGERERETIQSDKVTFNADGPMADLTGPFFAGVAVEKGKTRLVVINSLQSFLNQVLSWPDQDMLRRGVLVSRFPGNAELFNNSIFWLSRAETMIAISPSAMEVSRIKPMGAGELGFWRVGVLLILLPGLVLAAGIWMYFARRD